MLCKTLRSKFNSVQGKHICMSTATNPNHVSGNRHPQYDKIGFKSLRELAEHFKDNIIYYDRRFIVVNKPYGLRRYSDYSRGENLKTVPVKLSLSLTDMNDCCLQDVLPHFKEILNIPKLVMAKTPERYCSGVTIMAANEQLKDEFLKSFRREVKIPHFTYLAVCLGIPLQAQLSSRIALKLEQGKGLGDRNVTFVERWSKRKVQSGVILPVTIHHNTVSSNEKLQVSLVEISVTKSRWNCIRAYLALRMLSPLLGDSIFGSRVKCIGENRMLLQPTNPVASLPPKLPSNIMNILEINNRQVDTIPAHLHLSTVHVPNFYNNETYKFYATPPEHFKWTCDKLGLEIPSPSLYCNVSHKKEKTSKKYTFEDDGL